MLNVEKVRALLRLKAKYAVGSFVATMVDYGLYLALVYVWLGEEQKTLANVIAYPVGVIVNFILQKRYIFQMKRRLHTTFTFAMLVSAGGWALNAALFAGLMRLQFFNHYHLLAKVLVSGTVFFYNFYGKRYVFEKRFL